MDCVVILLTLQRLDGCMDCAVIMQVCAIVNNSHNSVVSIVEMAFHVPLTSCQKIFSKFTEICVFSS